jgi:homoserine acetyltransferase
MWSNIKINNKTSFVFCLQELGFDYTSTSPSEINHDVLFREGETRNVSQQKFNYYSWHNNRWTLDS